METESCYLLLLTSYLLPNIAQIVGQSSVNMTLALRAVEISTTRLTSNIIYIWAKNKQQVSKNQLFLKYLAMSLFPVPDP